MRFKPEDFDRVCDYEDMARRANELLEAHLATLPVVYEYLDEKWIVGYQSARAQKTALLWDVKPIGKKECEHEPRPDRDWCGRKIKNMPLECKFCGAKLQQITTIKYKSFENCKHLVMVDFSDIETAKCSLCGIKLKAKWESA